MNETTKKMLHTIATRSVIAAIPIAITTAYATEAVSTAPRSAEYGIHQVAEITVSPSTVGVAASPLYGQTKAQIDKQLNEMQALGVQNIRVFVPWGLIEFAGPTSPTSAYWSQLNLVMQSAAEHDMGVLAEINSTPPYAVTAGTAGSGTPNPAAFATFMTKFVTRYGSTVSAYEIWNEPNGIQSSNPINPAAYATLVKAAYTAIKPLDPTATVIAGALGHVLTTGLTMDPVDFVKAMVAADPTIGNYFDALSYHPYDTTLPFSQGNVNPKSSVFASDTAYNQAKDLMSLFPTKKVWISEFGVPTYSYRYVDGKGVARTVTITQQQQESLIKNLVTTWGTLGQAGPIFLYTGRDTATGSTNPNANYGLWTQQGVPKSVVTNFLKQYFLTHPQKPAGPVTPPTRNPIAQVTTGLQVLTQQVANAVVTTVANTLAGVGQSPPATAAKPRAVRTSPIAKTSDARRVGTTPTGAPTPTASQPTTVSTAGTGAHRTTPKSGHGVGGRGGARNTRVAAADAGTDAVAKKASRSSKRSAEQGSIG